ncbi:MAG: hypothetical protein EOP84_32905, partial [Verrucomicrobiaceae bacterium]
NPSKVVSGFGGTLCLVISFIYITVFVALVAIPDVRKVTPLKFWVPDELAQGSALFLSLAVLLIPMSMAWKKVKELEI